MVISLFGQSSPFAALRRATNVRIADERDEPEHGQLEKPLED
jgi:hypothetical protein